MVYKWFHNRRGTDLQPVFHERLQDPAKEGDTMKPSGWTLLILLLVIGCGVIVVVLTNDSKPPVKPAADESPLYASRLSATLQRFDDSFVRAKPTPAATQPATGTVRRAQPTPRVTPRPGVATPVPAVAGSARDALAEGRAAFERGQWEEALAFFDQAIAADAANHLLHSYRGDVLFRLRRFDEAIRSYERSYELSPSFVFALHGVGAAQYAKGDFEGALQTYRKILSLRPSDAAAQAQIAAIEARQSKTEAK